MLERLFYKPLNRNFCLIVIQIHNIGWSYLKHLSQLIATILGHWFGISHHYEALRKGDWIDVYTMGAIFIEIVSAFVFLEVYFQDLIVYHFPSTRLGSKVDRVVWPELNFTIFIHSVEEIVKLVFDQMSFELFFVFYLFHTSV